MFSKRNYNFQVFLTKVLISLPRYRHSFLRGNMGNACDDYFEDYKACVMMQLGKYSLQDLADFDKWSATDSPHGN